MYDAIIRDGGILTVVSKKTLADYANHNGGRLPMAQFDVKNVPVFFRFRPFAFQQNLDNHLGTTKLIMI